MKNTMESGNLAFFSDLLKSIWRDCQHCTSLHDNREDFSFHVTNSSLLPDYGNFIQQLIGYTKLKACSSLNVLFWWRCVFFNKLLGYDYVKELLKLYLRWSLQNHVWSHHPPNVTWHLRAWLFVVTYSNDQTLYWLATSLPNRTFLLSLTFYQIPKGS